MASFNSGESVSLITTGSRSGIGSGADITCSGLNSIIGAGAPTACLRSLVGPPLLLFSFSVTLAVCSLLTASASLFIVSSSVTFCCSIETVSIFCTVVSTASSVLFSARVFACLTSFSSSLSSSPPNQLNGLRAFLMSSKEGSRSDIKPVILFHTSASISVMLNPSNIERSKEKILFTKSINIVTGANNSPIRLPNPLNRLSNKPPINLNGAMNIFLINPTTILMPPKIASVILNSFNPSATLSNPKNPAILAITFFKNVIGNVTMSRINPPIVSSKEPVDVNLSFMFLNAVTIPPTNNAIPAATATNGAAAIRNPLIATAAPTANPETAVPMPVAVASMVVFRAVRPVPSNANTPLIPPAEAVAKRLLALRNIVDLVNANAAAYKSCAFLIPAATLDITPNLMASIPSIALNPIKFSAKRPMNPNTSPDNKAPRALNASERRSTT